jgi:hypothetical protein
MADQISSGLPELDRLLSEPLRPGEIADVPGPQATVKTDLRQLLIKHALENGGTAVHFDLEAPSRPAEWDRLLGRSKRDEPPDKPIKP